jgi:hypothetical protein
MEIPAHATRLIPNASIQSALFPGIKNIHFFFMACLIYLCAHTR